jgi:hypothetical protein
MKSYNMKRIITLLSISILMLLSSGCSGKPVPQEVKPDYMIFSIGKSGVEIRGILKNYSIVKKLFVDSETHISMVGEKEKLGVHLTGDGNLALVDKSLPQSTIKNNGSFSFKLENLPEGSYIFIIQPLRGNGSVKLVDLRTLEGLKLTISNSGPTTNLIDFGEVNVGQP